MLKFYFHQTPNPMKVALYLMETGLAYELMPIDTMKGEQHTPEYRARLTRMVKPQLSKMMATVSLIRRLF